MHRYLRTMFSDSGDGLRSKIMGIYTVLFLYHILVWLWTFYVFHDHPVLFSTAVLAYTFGLRHAVDADHIAAIDNVTRKLMQEGKKPVAAGLFFSLGHSTVVFVATVGLALTTTAVLQSNITRLQEITSVLFTSVSALFLLFIALINLSLFISVLRVLRQVNREHCGHREEIEQWISRSGSLSTSRFRHFIRLISHSWHMYPLGFLFGLGFDTASEIILLGITATEIVHGLPLWSVLTFPALFTAGMTLIDTSDSMLMVSAYGWAFVKPIRKLYYNATITLISVLVAIFLGTVEVLGLLAPKIKANGGVWNLVKEINSHFDFLGYLIITVFMFSWLISVLLYKHRQRHFAQLKMNA
ncbi:HoxN/HupN/NixA family nickel/cobalt transporter [Legionella worsleiensis]|uniref:Nickel/cobalt efflux system n=1 Tax=Legionella worsleiensis TaxID=45076 RepID=A0A0W1AJG5_9GAMM|nr:HoxN/HupN/NixA family nickel/cobalt transporter [Legionella worsleiensis]KTD81493.1 high-affinity nickel-transport protein [Legionella worsleiensis]STY32052.1 high-affinity nickel-transport protein [Legionella worsleiensis]